MKKYLVLATVFLLSSYANAANMTWYGSAGWRYGHSTETDGTSNTGTSTATPGGTISGSQSSRTENDQQFRAALGATGGWDNIEWGVGVRTQPGNNGELKNEPTSYAGFNTDWAATNGKDLAVGFENLWFKYGNDWGFGDIGVIFGRQAPAFVTGKNQLFLDNSVRFDGLAETWQWGSFGLNFAQYTLGGVQSGQGSGYSISDTTPYSQQNPSATSGITMLWGFQPTFKWKFTDDIAALIAVGYYRWQNATGSNFWNVIPNGGANGFAAGSPNSASSAQANSTNGTWNTNVSNENASMWQFLADVSLPYMLDVSFEMINNKTQNYGWVKSGGGQLDDYASPIVALSKTAWTAGISYGSLKKAHDFMIGYSYQSKGLGSVIDHYTYSMVAAGMNAHEVTAGYNIANNFNLSARGLFMSEKNGLNQYGVTTTGTIKDTYWEVSTGVKF